MKDIFDEMLRMQRDMDRMFNGFFQSRQDLFPNSKQLTKKSDSKSLANKSDMRTPVCNMYETEKDVVATFEIPGAKKDGIKLNVNENSLEINAKQKVENEMKDAEKGYYSYSSRTSQFYRALPLPTKVLPDKTVAVYEDGVLKITMPKEVPSKAKKGKRIEIQ